MPISLVCPTCGTKMKAPDTALGKKVKCPKCASLVNVTEEGDEAAAISSAPASKPKPKPIEDELDDVDDLPEGGDEPLDEEDEEDGADEEGRPKKKRKGNKGDGALREDDKTWGMFAHLAGTFFGWLGALIVYLMKKDESAYLRYHTKESLNFQLTMIVGWVVAFLCSCCIGCGGGLAAGFNEMLHLLVNLASALPFMALGAMNLIFTIMAALAAKKGDRYKYPFCIRMIK